MVEKIIQEAFKKAERECASKAKNALAKHISEEIEKSFGFIINERTLVRAYDKYVLSKEDDESPPSRETVNAFCVYLGYKNYKDYVDDNNKAAIDKHKVIEEIENEFLPVKKRRSKWFLSVALLVIISILGLLLFKVSGIGNNVDTIAKQCLYWEVDRYRPIECDKVLPQAIAKTKVPFNEVLYTNFRKVSNAELANYSTVLWQGASPTGEMDYFATNGVHPLTQKKLVRVEPETIKNISEKERTEIVERAPPKNNSVPTVGTLIFEDQKLDEKIIAQLERTHFKSFNSIGNLMSTRTIPESKKSELLVGNFSYINKNQMNGLDYLCVGSISYSYKSGKLSSETISCRLSLDYDVFATSSGIKQNELSRSITVNGIGFSEAEAKANALKKIKGE